MEQKGSAMPKVAYLGDTRESNKIRYDTQDQQTQSLVRSEITEAVHQSRHDCFREHKLNEERVLLKVTVKHMDSWIKL